MNIYGSICIVRCLDYTKYTILKGLFNVIWPIRLRLVDLWTCGLP